MREHVIILHSSRAYCAAHRLAANQLILESHGISEHHKCVGRETRLVRLQVVARRSSTCENGCYHVLVFAVTNIQRVKIQCVDAKWHFIRDISVGCRFRLWFRCIAHIYARIFMDHCQHNLRVYPRFTCKRWQTLLLSSLSLSFVLADVGHDENSSKATKIYFIRNHTHWWMWKQDETMRSKLHSI